MRCERREERKENLSIKEQVDGLLLVSHEELEICDLLGEVDRGGGLILLLVLHRALLLHVEIGPLALKLDERGGRDEEVKVGRKLG